jgi:hypothetical protein
VECTFGSVDLATMEIRPRFNCYSHGYRLIKSENNKKAFDTIFLIIQKMLYAVVKVNNEIYTQIQ